MSNFTKSAFVTLATNETYAKSALVLLQTLKNVGTECRTVIMVANEASIGQDMMGMLKAGFDRVVNVEALIAEHSTKYDVLSRRPELAVTYTKLHAFSLTEFQACCFLDADTMVVENIDGLLSSDDVKFSAVPEFAWPDSFNSGVFVFKPDSKVYEELLKLAGESGASYDGGDQGLLNNYFSEKWVRLSVLYNMPVKNFGQAFQGTQENYGFSPAFMKFGGSTKVVHFIGGGSNKPWCGGNTGGSNSTVQHFKSMWANNLKEAMRRFKPVCQNESVSHSEVSQVSEAKVGEEKVVEQNPSFDDIWTHISSQF